MFSVNPFCERIKFCLVKVGLQYFSVRKKKKYITGFSKSTICL